MRNPPTTVVPVRLPATLRARLEALRVRLGPDATASDALRYAVARVRMPKP